MKNKTIVLNSRPVGIPAKDNFKFIQTGVPDLQQGEVLLKALYISVDPYRRGRMSDAKSYAAPYEVGEPVTGGVVAEVVESSRKNFRKERWWSGICRGSSTPYMLAEACVR